MSSGTLSRMFVGVSVASFFLLVFLAPAVQAQATLSLQLGTAHVKASGGAYCYSTTPNELGWSWDGSQNIYYRFVDLSQYTDIQVSALYDMRAPGLLDTAHVEIAADQRAADGSWTRMDLVYLSSGDDYRTGTLTGTSMAIGASDWRFILDETGLDGTPWPPYYTITCGPTNQYFYVYTSTPVVASISPSSQTVYYNPTGCIDPTAEVHASATGGGGHPYTWTWTWGDGSTDTMPDQYPGILHTYPYFPYTWTVRLRATDYRGTWGEATATVTVVEVRWC